MSKADPPPTESPADELADSCLDHELEIQRLRDRLSAAQSVNRTLKRRLNKVEADANTISTLTEPKRRKYPKAIQTSKTGRGSAAAIVMLNDWHYEMQFPADAVEGVNFNDLEESNRKLTALGPNVVKMIDFAHKQSEIDELWLFWLGDFIHGDIHPEYAYTNSLGPMEAVNGVRDHLVSLTEYWKKTIKPKRMAVVGTRGGNHGRTTRRMFAEGAHNHNLEWLTYGNVARIVNDPSIEWRLGKHLTNPVEIKGRLVRPTHGDAIKFGGGIGGITVPINKRMMRWNQIRQAELLVMGHYHEELIIPGIVVGAALIGFDPFAMQIGARPGPPGQELLVIDEKRGLVLHEQVFVR